MMESSEETKTTQQQQEQQPELKHLGFVRATAINTIMWLSSLYEYAKQNSGPLKSAVSSVEGAVTTVVTPVYDKFKDVPDHLLAFLDQKVDVAEKKFDEHAPPLAKQVASRVHGVIGTAAQKAKELVHQAQVGGPLAAARYAAEESKNVVLDQSVKVWCKLDQLPPVHLVSELTVPTAAHLSEKYNKLITDLRAKGHSVFNYVPLVPSEEIAKAVKQYKGANEQRDVNEASQPAEEEVSSQ